MLADETVLGAQAGGWIKPLTPGGKPFSVRQFNFGPLGWISDRRGYRYEARHPETGAPWPPIPNLALELWRFCLPGAPEPECCLVNHYSPDARMGLHRDADEAAIDTPVLSISLGAPARFRLGGLEKRSPTQSTVLESGDVLVFGGEARLAYHGVDRLLAAAPETLGPLSLPGRLNLTLRRVTESA